MITRLIAGNQVITLGTAIEQQFLVAQNWGMGSTIAVFLVLLCFSMMFTESKIERRSRIMKNLSAFRKSI